MKKNLPEHSFSSNKELRKFLKAMRNLLFVFCLGIIQVSASVTIHGQTLMMMAENKTVREIFKEIENQTNYRFFYNDEFRDLSNNLSIEMRDYQIGEVLDIMLADSDVTYRILENDVIVITPRGSNYQAIRITGVITEEGTNMPLPGASIMVQGTTIGTVTDLDGNYSLEVPGPDAVLQISYVGYITETTTVGDQRVINASLMPDVSALGEFVVVGYGIQKKVNLTGAVSVATREQVENRPVGNVQQALQGLVPNLVITTSNAGGEPGADMSMNIRGLQSFLGSSSPYVLVDGVPMSINNIDPNNIETISVLKDAASAAIYGARAANGVILITTKSGRDTGLNVSYSANVATMHPLSVPQLADAMSLAHAFNDAARNQGMADWYKPETLERLAQNMANPGSAPEVFPRTNGLDWDMNLWGLNGAANNDWYDILYKDYGLRKKHNLSISGVTGNTDYFLSGGFYDEEGIFEQWKDGYNRLNFDGKIGTQATPWLNASVLFKFNKDEEDFPSGRASMYDIITKIKPTMPKFYPGTDVWWRNTYIMQRQQHRQLLTGKQFVISPRLRIEPIKGWVTNVELNYISNESRSETSILKTFWIRPNGDYVYEPSQEGTAYYPSINTSEYLSPTVYSTYTRSFGKHNLNALAGYQNEVNKFFNLSANAQYLLSDDIPSLSTAVGTKNVSDGLGHWATESYFGRLGYNYDEKYFIEANFRADGSSRFEPGRQWGNFPSVSAAWVLSNEDFFPLKDQISLLKIRASQGTLGNQNVANYLYVPTMNTGQTGWLFNNTRRWWVGTPNLTSIALTWEKVSTTNLGLDFGFLNDRLIGSVDVYQAYTTDLVGPGDAVPALLGTSVPRENSGEIRTRGFELELAWRNRVRDFSYEIRGVLSDNQSVVTQYNNPTKLLNTYYEGMVLGEYWGYETMGLFQSVEEVQSAPSQSFIMGGVWNPGDVRYVDQNDDGAINNGTNTLDDHGDMVIVGNRLPRYLFGLNLNASYKGFSLSATLQGVGKQDAWVSASDNGNHFRGPANGQMHATVLKEHLDYWRDETSALGANPDAYFARPYHAFTGQNNKNYQIPNDRYMQNRAYVRLKSVQVSYNIPQRLTQKAFISNAQIYVSGENLLTYTNLMMFDPEALDSRLGTAKTYPMSRVFSLGLNVNF